jgi:hypothetical protein
MLLKFKNCFYECLYRETIFIFFLSRTIGLDKLNYILKLSVIVQNKFVKTMTSMGPVVNQKGKLLLHLLIQEIFLNLCLKNYWTRKAEIYMQAFLHSTKASLLTLLTPGVDWDHNRGNYFCMCLCRKNILKILLSRTTRPEKMKFT